MSHFTVMVIGENPEEQLEPFNEQPEDGSEYAVFNNVTDDLTRDYAEDNCGCETLEEYATDYCGYEFFDEYGAYGYFHNPNAKWDWYKLGGRWAGFFKLKASLDGAGKRGENGLMGSCRNDTNLHVDQALKGEIDFDGMISDDMNLYAERYDSIAALFPNSTIPKIEKPWGEFLKMVDNNEMTITEARDAYANQSSIQEWKAVSEIISKNRNSYPESLVSNMTWGSLSDYQLPRDEYINLAGRKAIIPFAVLIDGEWFEKGSMGWFGCVSDPMDENEWVESISNKILSLPDDTLISVFDCHI